MMVSGHIHNQPNQPNIPPAVVQSEPPNIPPAVVQSEPPRIPPAVVQSEPPSIPPNQPNILQIEPLSEQPSKQPSQPRKPIPLWWLAILLSLFFLGVAFAVVTHRRRQMAPPVIPDENV